MWWSDDAISVARSMSAVSNELLRALGALDAADRDAQPSTVRESRSRPPRSLAVSAVYDSAYEWNNSCGILEVWVFINYRILNHK